MSMITLATAIAAIATVSVAQAGVGIATFAGSKSVATRPTPMPPRVQNAPVNHVGTKLLNCYHTRAQNELGVRFHRARCG
jgi:hypothetical protein